MRKVFLALCMVPSIVLCMEGSEDGSDVHERPLYQIQDADWTLMKAIERSNYNEVLEALHKKANQNYLWPMDDDECKRYADLTAGIFALKRVKEENRTNYVWGLASAVTRDISRNAMSYVLSNYATQYPMLTYVAPLSESSTAGYLFGSQFNAQPVVELYRPEKRIAQVVLTKDDTNLTIERKAKWQGNPVTVMTYLNKMLKSYNPLTRKDGEDLSKQLSRVQCRRAGVNLNEGEGGIVLGDGVSAQILGFSNAGNGVRSRSGGRVIILPNDQ
jgi:hypothetical protein